METTEKSNWDESLKKQTKVSASDDVAKNVIKVVEISTIWLELQQLSYAMWLRGLSDYSELRDGLIWLIENGEEFADMQIKYESLVLKEIDKFERVMLKVGGKEYEWTKLCQIALNLVRASIFYEAWHMDGYEYYIKEALDYAYKMYFDEIEKMIEDITK